MTFVKLLLRGLDEDEIKILENVFGTSSTKYYLLLLRTEEESDKEWLIDYLDVLDATNVSIFKKVKLDKKNDVLFIKEDVIDVENIQDTLLQFNRRYNWSIKAVLSNPIDDILDSAQEIKRMQNELRYFKLGGFKRLEQQAESNLHKKAKHVNITENKQLYEFIRSGKYTEARQIIYDQWYSLIENKADGNAIDVLYYVQTNILTQVADDLKYDIKIPLLSCDLDIVSIFMSIDACAKELCKYVVNNKQGIEEEINRLVDYIESHYCDSSFYMQNMMDEFSMTQKSINRIIKNHTGQTFSVYVSNLRMQKAIELLQTTDMLIDNIALNSGFSSSNSFLKAFKKAYGVSPSTYRENISK